MNAVSVFSLGWAVADLRVEEDMSMTWGRGLAATGAFAVLFGCTEIVERAAPEIAPADPPAARWDHHPNGEEWTGTVVSTLSTHGAPLVQVVPQDMDRWCPAYATASEDQRKAFWVGLLSSLAKHESTWQPTVSGGNGRWHGLLQISPGTARGYGCAARSAETLKDGSANLSCGIRIMASTVPRDGVISAGGGGVAADWGPFHQSRKREDMRQWVSNQSYCQLPAGAG
ncbi:MAG: transglycosylase SLT domain-containing protein [Pseudomonadota bacterium]